MVHIYWASDARNQWSHAKLHIFLGNQQCGIHMYLYNIFLPYWYSFWLKLSYYGKKILYTYVYHIVGYLGKCEALHEIINFVREMLSICAPLRYDYIKIFSAHGKSHSAWLWLENSDWLFVDWSSRPISNRNFPVTVMNRALKSSNANSSSDNPNVIIETVKNSSSNLFKWNQIRIIVNTSFR